MIDSFAAQRLKHIERNNADMPAILAAHADGLKMALQEFERYDEETLPQEVIP